MANRQNEWQTEKLLIKKTWGRLFSRWCGGLIRFLEQLHSNWKLKALDKSKWKCLVEACVLQWNYIYGCCCCWWWWFAKVLEWVIQVTWVIIHWEGNYCLVHQWPDTKLMCNLQCPHLVVTRASSDSSSITGSAAKNRSVTFVCIGSRFSTLSLACSSACSYKYWKVMELRLPYSHSDFQGREARHTPHIVQHSVLKHRLIQQPTVLAGIPQSDRSMFHAVC